jgi:SPP1 gp7 family putative phage head morphogenesis protein
MLLLSPDRRADAVNRRPQLRHPLAVPEHLERRYRSVLWRRCAALRAAVNAALRSLQTDAAIPPNQISYALDLIGEIEKAFAANVPADEVAEHFAAVNAYTTRGLALHLSRATGEPVTVEQILGLRRPELPAERQEFVTANAELITSIDRRYLADVRGLVERADMEGWGVAELRSQLAARYGVSLSRAQLIAEDQTGKVHGQVNQIRQTQLGIQRYIWRANRDRLTRPLHAHRNGKEFPWWPPPNEEHGDGHPGHPINCRCFADPVLP